MALASSTKGTLGTDAHTIDLTGAKAAVVIVSSEAANDPVTAITVGGVLNNRARDTVVKHTGGSLRMEYYLLQQAEIEAVIAATSDPLNAVAVVPSSAINIDNVITMWSCVGISDQDVGIRTELTTIGVSVSGPLGNECSGGSNCVAGDVGFAVCGYAPGNRATQGWATGQVEIADLETKNGDSSHAGAVINPAVGGDVFTVGWSSVPGSDFLMATVGLYEIDSGPPQIVGTGYVSVANDTKDLDELFQIRSGDEIKAAPTGFVTTNFDRALPSDADPAGPWDLADLFVYRGSPAAEAVLDRMTSLSQAEENAIIRFVDNLESDGLWQYVVDFFALQLNFTDHLTGFKGGVGALVPTGNPAHSPGVGVTFQDDEYYRTTQNCETIWLTGQSGFLCYLDQYLAVDGAFNTSAFGASDSATRSTQCIWTGNVSQNLLVKWSASAFTPLVPDSGVRQEGGIVGAGGSGTFFNWALDVDGTINSAPRTAGLRPQGIPFQMNGRNNNGPSADAKASRHAMWLFVDKNTGLLTGDITQLRTRMQELYDELSLALVAEPGFTLTGSIGADSTLRIERPAGGFGSGPSVVMFDDFRGGNDGDPQSVSPVIGANYNAALGTKRDRPTGRALEVMSDGVHVITRYDWTPSDEVYLSGFIDFNGDTGWDNGKPLWLAYDQNEFTTNDGLDSVLLQILTAAQNYNIASNVTAGAQDTGNPKWSVVSNVAPIWFRFWGKASAPEDGFLQLITEATGLDLDRNYPEDLTTDSWLENVRAGAQGWGSLNFVGFASSPPATADMYVGSLYLTSGANAQARVELTDSAVYADSKKVAVATPDAWADDDVTVTVRPGVFSAGETVYVWLTAGDGTQLYCGSGVVQ